MIVSPGGLRLLDLQISFPPQLAWHSAAARGIWKNRLLAASRLVDEVGLESVSRGLRDAAAVRVSAATKPWVHERLEMLGLRLVPLPGSFGVGTAVPLDDPAVPGGDREPGDDPVTMALAIEQDAAPPTTIEEALDALGYPACCRRERLESVRCGVLDPVPAEAAASKPETVEELGPQQLKVNGSAATNTLLRQIGIVLVPYLPCSFDCPATTSTAAAYLDLARSLGAEEAAWLLALLEMPLRWDALKGVAIVSSPIFRFSAPSVPVWPRLVVDFVVAAS